MARVSLTSLARQDLDAIWSYIAQHDIVAADRLIDAIHQRCEVYAKQPHAAASGDRFQLGLRFFVVGNYVAFFQPRDDGLLVVRVLHGARNLEDLFGG